MKEVRPLPHSRPRARFRRPRFLSLSRELAATLPRSQNAEPPLHGKPRAKPRSTERRREGGIDTADDAILASQQLDLFPLHPGFQPQEEDDRHAATFFDADYYATATLTSLLGLDQDDAEAPEDSFSFPAEAQHAADSPASSSPGYDATVCRDLAKSVLRGRERWVLCQDEDQEEGEASSCGGAVTDPCSWWAGNPARTQLCFLKLDYDEVLSAWTGTGSVYVEREAAQVVPNKNKQNYLLEQPEITVEVPGSGSDSCGSNLWVVPRDSSVGGRESRVLRYKEKRQNRLFAKRIRYEVRKLNAQKRPRSKGRFVKRIQEQA